MKFEYSDKAITGMLLVVPEQERLFTDEMKLFNFPERRSLRLKEVMGYHAHRIVDDGVCASDLAEYGFRHLFESGKLRLDEIDALVYVTLSPDRFSPPTSCDLHGRLGLREDAFCVDITQGCCGFVIGLQQAFALLEQPSVRKVAVVNADVLSRKVSPRDRNSYPLIGDAAAITIVECVAGAGKIHGDIRMDGTGADALRIPAGGFRMPSTPETAVMQEDAEGNFRAPDNMVMDGTAVFNFVMARVPGLIQDVSRQACVPLDAVDAFFFHQPNRFMLQKLAEKLGVPYEKMPSNVVEYYGNSSGATIPSAITLNAAERVCAAPLQVCFSGFGVGLTWGALMMRLLPFDYCETINYPSKKEIQNGH